MFLLNVNCLSSILGGSLSNFSAVSSSRCTVEGLYEESWSQVFMKKGATSD